MLDADWYATDRATEPARIEMLSGENRLVSIGLSQAVAPGEVIRPLGMTTTLRRYGKPESYSAALDGSVLYNSGSKTAAQKVDASKIPQDTPAAFVVNFDVETLIPGVIDRRSVLLVIIVRV